MRSIPVVIVGAGISGIYLASKLKQKGIESLVLESGPIHGGRIKSVYVSNEWIELGAARVISSQKRVMALIAELQLELVPEEFPDCSLFWDGEFHESMNHFLKNRLSKNPVEVLRKFLETSGIHNLDDFSSLAMKEWDQVLFKIWLQNHGISPEEAKIFFLGDIDVNLEQISLYEAAYFLLLNHVGGEETIFRLKKGMKSIPDQMIEKYQPQIRCNEEVLSIKKVTGGHEIQTNQGIMIAEKVVLTCSVHALNKIKLDRAATGKIVRAGEIGFYGKSKKGYFLLPQKINRSMKPYLLTDDCFRIIRKNDFLYEWYLLSLFKDWEISEIQSKIKQYFGYEPIDFQVETYKSENFGGSYWIYRTGMFHRIHQIKEFCQLDKNLFSVGEHFSENPNWIEGSLESADYILNTFFL
jgi:monoamine oxidase